MANEIRLARRRALGHLALALLTSMAVAACGGSDGNDGPPPLSAPTTPVSINASNGEAVAAVALGATVDTFGSSEVTLLGAQVETDTAPTKPVVGRITSRNLRRVVESTSSAPTVTGVAQSEPCNVAGSVTVSGSPTSFKLTFNGCSDVPGQVINGWLSVTDFAYTGTNYSGSESGSVRLDLSVTESGITTRIVGDFVLAESWTPDVSTIQMTGSSLGYTDGTNTEILSNFDLRESDDFVRYVITSSADFTIASTKLGGAVTVDTVTPFQASTTHMYPYAGSMVITGAAGSQLSITVLGDETDPAPQVRLELDANGDGTFELMTEISWSTLASP